jgi:Zn-dependent M28 family amino/carboxypeptidase
VRTQLTASTAKAEADNVIGVLRGSDPAFRDQYVLATAHLDHLGVGQPINGDAIYNGAMDNAAGLASLIEIAKVLNGTKLKRSILFSAVTGEEGGLMGSRYFAARPTVTEGSIVANVNVDMFLPLFPLKALTVYGLDESDLGPMFAATAKRFGVAVEPDPEPHRNLFIRSDQYSFIRRGIPALFFKIHASPGSQEQLTAREWLRTRYHAPSDDTRQPVDRAAAARFNEVVGAFLTDVANAGARPQWNAGSFFRRM